LLPAGCVCPEVARIGRGKPASAVGTSELGFSRALPKASPTDLRLARGLALGIVVAAFPTSAVAVFMAGVDRHRAADALALCYALGLFAAFTTSWWPLPGLRQWSRAERVTSMAFLFMLVSYATHLSWELGWLLLHPWIADARDALWAYPWWAYIDGGDARYANPSATLRMMESLSVLNGLVGVTGLRLVRVASQHRRGVMLLMATAVVHLYSTSLYFGSELLEGLPNVDTTRVIDLWFKFVLANAPWLVFPPFVLLWGYRALTRSGDGGDPQASAS
jgi:EXPERA (EXPanded EBP superfamily)